MKIDLTPALERGLAELTTRPQCLDLCNFALEDLRERAVDNRIFIRYMRQVSPNCVALNFSHDLGHRCAVAVGYFGPGPEKVDGNVLKPNVCDLYVGASACHPSAILSNPDGSARYVMVQDEDGELVRAKDNGGADIPFRGPDRWERNLGRLVASLRAVRIPRKLALLWAIESPPWLSLTIDNVFRVSQLQRMRLPDPWQALDTRVAGHNVFPKMVRPAVVAVVKQAMRYALYREARTMDIYNNGDLCFGNDLQRTEVNASLKTAEQIVDQMCTLPQSLPYAERHKFFEEKAETPAESPV